MQLSVSADSCAGSCHFLTCHMCVQADVKVFRVAPYLLPTCHTGANFDFFHMPDGH